MRPLGPLESIHDNLARDAAIAEMGRRLAAPGLRARRRQIHQLSASRQLYDGGGPAAWPAPQPVTWKDALVAGPSHQARSPVSTAPLPTLLAGARPAREISWARHIAMFRRITLLGATAACGFAVVLYAEEHRVTAPFHGSPGADRVATLQEPKPEQEQALVAPAQVAQAPLVMETLAEEELPGPEAEILVVEVAAPPEMMQEGEMPAALARPSPVRVAAGPALNFSEPALAEPALAEPTSAEPASAEPAVAASAPTAYALSASARDRRVVQPVPLLLARAGGQMRARLTQARLIQPRLTQARLTQPHLTQFRVAQPHVLLARYEFPRWLTEKRSIPPPARIMSEPPHDLAVPRAEITNPKPSPTPRPASPRAMYAYASPYAYPYYYRPYYPLPPLRQPAFYTAPPQPDQ